MMQNPFNGIERGDKTSPQRLKAFMLESIQWNWKITSRSRWPRLCRASESIQWNWKFSISRPPFSPVNKYHESIQWNWKCIILIRKIVTSAVVLNPFNGIESIYDGLELSIVLVVKESIQWNWKVLNLRCWNQTLTAHRIHSMELKANTSSSNVELWS